MSASVGDLTPLGRGLGRGPPRKNFSNLLGLEMRILVQDSPAILANVK